jgi:polar amino acid transport system substrate-binding protein
MGRRWWLLWVFLGVVWPVVAEPKPLVMNMSPGGFPPYMIYDPEAGIQRGILYDVLVRLVEPLGYHVVTDAIPRKRVAQMLAAGSLDVSERAKEWEEDPSQYAWSDPVVEVENRVISLAKAPLEFRTAQDLAGKSVATILGYSYPELDEAFHSGLVQRTDVLNPESQIRMVLAGRTDGAILYGAVAEYTIRTADLPKAQLSLSRSGFGAVGYRFMFGKRWEFLIPALNRGLAKLKESGELDRIVNGYR